MKIAIVLAVAVACALAAPVDEKDAQIVASVADIRPDGSFDAKYETSNGIVSEETGEVKEGRDEKNNALQFVVRRGRYSWTDKEGQQHTIAWTADENGYQAEGADVPRAPQ